MLESQRNCSVTVTVYFIISGISQVYVISHQQIANQIKSTWNQTITNYYAGDGDTSVNYGAVSLFWTATNRYVCTVRLSTVCLILFIC